MPNGFVQVTGVPNTVTATPMVDTQRLGLNDYFNSDSLILRDGLREFSEYYNMRDSLSILELSNRTGTTRDLEVRSYEQGPMFRPVKIGAVVGTATASEAVVTLSADSFTGQGSIDGVVQQTSLMQDDLIRFVDGNTALVRIKSGSGAATQFTLRGITGASGSIAASIAAQGSVPLFVFSNAYGEAAEIPKEGLEQSSTQWRNQAQIIQTFRAASGDVNALYMQDWTGKDRYFYKQELEMGPEHRIKEKLAIWFGSGGFSTNEKGQRVRLCVGVDTAIEKMGNLYNVVPGTFERADLDALVDQIEAVHGGNVYDFYAGHKLTGEVQQVFTEITAGGGQTGIDWSNFGEGDAKQKMVDVGILGIVYRGVTFRLMQTDMLSLPEMTGINGYLFPNDGYLIPSKKQSVNTTANGRTNKLTIDSLKVLYTTEYTGEQRRYKFTKYGPEVLKRDETEMNLFTQVVPQIVNTRKMIKIKAVAS